MRRPLRLILIYGSARPGRLCDTVARWVAEQTRAHGAFEIDTLDPLAADFPPNTAALGARIGQADAAIVVTPEYNHSYPAPLKALIDSADREWSAKTVAFVAYGGASGGLRAVEHLRNVFAELDAHTLRETVSFAHAWEQFGPDGELRSSSRAPRAMNGLLDRLAWWSDALRAARDAEPVAERAA
ncbi:NAD(P)H-dependent oxidoreductase [Chelatococcus sambhunathii]|uniref:NAD(P)H-dependent oxidoreductase n=1 Tax=Chelatococcus sambhunathii TaxID=363953 RepID=A0ABU1DKG9_9HYPH|nr:NAD(P)H-dependent oxidoreductase [Chelatococcus sambhunathii]MDR4308627.1 NAD(P)H-dependent oxidoreductase [Chelatococcus sambhunathii]